MPRSCQSFWRVGFTLVGKADRIDELGCGGYAIWDYKTGTPPTPPVIETFDPQLPLEAIILEAGGFPSLPAGRVRKFGHIGLGADASFNPLITGKILWPPRGKDPRELDASGFCCSSGGSSARTTVS